MPTAKWWTGAVWQPAKNIKWWTGSAWQAVKTLRRWDGSAWQIIHQGGLTVSGSTIVSGNCSRVTVGSCTATTAAASVTASGGSGTRTYAWEYVSGDAATAVSPSAASTTFTRAAGANFPAVTKSGIYRCKVTDTVLGTIVYGPNCTVYTEHEYTG